MACFKRTLATVLLAPKASGIRDHGRFIETIHGHGLHHDAGEGTELAVNTQHQLVFALVVWCGTGAWWVGGGM